MRNAKAHRRDTFPCGRQGANEDALPSHAIGAGPSIIRAAALALVAAMAAGAHAQQIDIMNAGFEDDPLADDEFSYGTFGGAPGWLGGPVDFTWGAWNPPTDAYPDETPEGTNLGWLYNQAGDGQATMTQALEATVQPNTTYTLSMHIGNPQAYFSEFNNFFYELDGFPGYRVELRAGDIVMVMDDNSLSPPDGTFEPMSISYDVGDEDPAIGETISIHLINLNDGPGFEVDFDDVQLVAASGCSADCNEDGMLNILDFVCYQNLFQSGDPSADCNGDGALNILDFVCFQGLFEDGCP